MFINCGQRECRRKLGTIRPQINQHLAFDTAHMPQITADYLFDGSLQVGWFENVEFKSLANVLLMPTAAAKGNIVCDQSPLAGPAQDIIRERPSSSLLLRKELVK